MSGTKYLTPTPYHTGESSEFAEKEKILRVSMNFSGDSKIHNTLKQRYLGSEVRNVMSKVNSMKDEYAVKC